MGDSFVHLHVHTEYSMLDGAARLGDLFGEVSRLGMPALAMTDHGNTFGAYDFYQQARKAGVKPIIGMEAYLTPGTHRSQRTRVRWAEGGENDVSGGGAYTHMTLLAENARGLCNLFRLASMASIEGFFYKPRIDRELLQDHAEGLIATTGCPSGEVQTWLRIGDYGKAREAAAEFQEIFGKENYYLELMDHGLGIERRVREDLMRLKDDLGLPPVASNDLHYTFAGDAQAQEVLLCVQSGKTLADPNRFKFDAHDFYLKTAQEMRELWDSEVSGACDATLEIAERVGSYDEVFAFRDLMPRVPVPEGETEESWLRTEVARGLERRFRGEVPETYTDQARYEIDVIAQKGYPGYFLVVADLCRHAKETGIRVGPGRGSAAGALIAYALGITELDPMEHGLIFERFLNPERESMPDIDLDFDERRRSDMIRYATEKYGDDHVAQIITYGTIKAKAAIKDAARVLGYSFSMSDRVSKAMPPAVMGKEISLAGIFDPENPRHGEAGEFRQQYEADEDVRQVVDTARGLEGLKRQWGVHAAGVILSREPLLDVIPIQKREQDGAIITQFDMGACESVGLLKMDFLGLRNLTVLDDALRSIEANRDIVLDLEQLDLDDKAAYELLSRGDTLGVFQLDGGPMRSLLRQMKPDSFKDISAVLALYRPGPMGANSHVNYAERKNGRQQVQPIHPQLAEDLDDILGETYGLIVFQEQVMAIAQRVAGYSLGQADLLRRAMGKKKKEVLDKEFVPFSEGMRHKGYGEDVITTLWDILVPFSDYAFNRAHTAGYGLVSYWTAYLKANYPAEYMSALLTSVRDDKDKSALYLSECRRMGIRVYPPDVNESEENFTARGDDILFGLGAVRNVGSNVVQSIVRTRKASGRFVDFADFLQKVEAVVCNKRTIESLIKAGAFDSLGHSRRGLCEQHEAAVDAVIGVKREEAKGQFDLFAGDLDGDTGRDPGFGLDMAFSAEEWKKSVLLSFEREMLGLYVSSHPLMGFEHVLGAKTDCSIAALSTDRTDGETVAVGGIVSAVQRKLSKKGNAFAIVTVEDLDSTVDVMFFSSTYELYATELAEDAVVVVKGRLDKREDAPRMVASDLTVLDINQDTDTAPIRVAMSTSKATQPLVAELKRVLETHPGTTEVQLKLHGATNTMLLRIDDGLRVSPSPALMGDLKALLGPSCLD